MISATTLSRSYTSFWAETVPWLSGYISSVNKFEIERLFPPMLGQDDPAFRAINNTIAFYMFTGAIESESGAKDFEAAQAKAFHLLQNLPRNNLDRYAITDMDSSIIHGQMNRLIERYRLLHPTTNPYFPGCGVLLAAEGDLHYESTLVEIKAGDRDLYPADIKQLLVYGALNFQSDQRIPIEYFELFNPRQGSFFRTSLDDLCSNISDKSKEEIFTEICAYGEGIAFTSQ